MGDPRVFLRKQGLLVVDAFEGRLTLNVIPAMSTDVVVIPGVNKPFNDHLKQLYCDWPMAGDHVLTSWTLKRPRVELVCE
jgi:hypothetical protein